jgi:hypothetical protein
MTVLVSQAGFRAEGFKFHSIRDPGFRVEALGMTDLWGCSVQRCKQCIYHRT